MTEKFFTSTENREERSFKMTLGLDILFYPGHRVFSEPRLFIMEVNGHDSGVRFLLKSNSPRMEYKSNSEVGAGLFSVKEMFIKEVLPMIKESNISLICEMQLANAMKSQKYIMALLSWAHRWEAVYPDFVFKIKGIMKNLNYSSIFRNAYDNPPEIELLCNDKVLQQQIIPKNYTIRRWFSGESYESQFGRWIVKDRSGFQGRGTFVLSDKELSMFSSLPSYYLNRFIIQEYIPGEIEVRIVVDVEVSGNFYKICNQYIESCRRKTVSRYNLLGRLAGLKIPLLKIGDEISLYGEELSEVTKATGQVIDNIIKYKNNGSST
jgi:hypothetical protein